jgi:hypothetical protein
MPMRDVNPLVGAGAARQGRCQQVKENLQVKQVIVADVDVRLIICHKPSACFGLAAFTYLPALSQCILRRILITTVNSR